MRIFDRELALRNTCFIIGKGRKMFICINFSKVSMLVFYLVEFRLTSFRETRLPDFTTPLINRDKKFNSITLNFMLFTDT